MVRLSLALTASFLVFWISVLGSSNYLLYKWQSSTKALSSSLRIFELAMWARIMHKHRNHSISHSTVLVPNPHVHYTAATIHQPSLHGHFAHQQNSSSSNVDTMCIAFPPPPPPSLNPGPFVDRTCRYYFQRPQQYSAPLDKPLSSNCDSSSDCRQDLSLPQQQKRQQRRVGIDKHHPSSIPLQPPSSTTNDLLSQETAGRGSNSNSRKKWSRMSSLLYRGSSSFAATSTLSSGKSSNGISKAGNMKNEVSTGSATTAAVSDDGNSPASVAPTPSPSPPDGGKNDADAPSASTYHLDNRQRLKAQRHGVSARRTWNKKTPPSKFLFFHSANSPTNADKGMPGLLSSISPPPATPHSAPPAGTQHRKRAMASPRASGQPTKTLAVPDELTPLAILPEEPNGITSIFAISIVLIFATFVAF